MIKHPTLKAFSFIAFITAFALFLRFGLTQIERPLSTLEALSVKTVNDFSFHETPSSSSYSQEDKSYPTFDIQTLKIVLIKKDALGKTTTYEIKGEDKKEHLIRIIELVKETRYFTDDIVTVQNKAQNRAQNNTPDMDPSNNKSLEFLNNSNLMIIEDKNVVFKAVIPQTEVSKNIRLINMIKLIEIFQ